MTLTIGSRATPEEEILGHIYVQALNAVGYDAKGEFGIETEYRDAPLKELEYGHISGYPEQVDAELRLFLGVEEEDMPRVAQKAYELARAKLAKQHLTAFPPTPYSVNRQVGMLRQTAEGRHLKTVSDLRGQAEEMMLSGFEDCHRRLDCLGGIERYYRIYFKGFSGLYDMAEIKARYASLKEGDFDASILYSTDGHLAGKKSKFVILEDDKHALPAGNVIFLTAPKIVEEAGPDFKKTIVAAQRGLTLPVMQRLVAEVELEKKDPAGVAAGYLKRIRLGP